VKIENLESDLESVDEAKKGGSKLHADQTPLIGGMGAIILVLLISTIGLAVANNKDAAVAMKPDNTCWKPLLEMDGRGFLFAQQHVAAFLQDSKDSTLVMTDLPPMSRAQGGTYNYPLEVDLLIKKLSNITTQKQKTEIKFFDGKLDTALVV